MTREPRQGHEYNSRQVEAARRVLIDLGQVLAAFEDCLVLVGGWVPDLLIENPAEAHVGSIDVDLALDTQKLADGRYAELLKLLLDTGRYRQGRKDFQFIVDVDLNDDQKPVEVEVEFLAPTLPKLKKNDPKLVPEFRVLQIDVCAAAFRAPVEKELKGKMVQGAENIVRFRVASIEDFLVMKLHALDRRDKPKDAYDINYCLDHWPGGIEQLAAMLNELRDDPYVASAVGILRKKFSSVEHFGPMQVVEFLGSSDSEERDIQARRAFELARRLLNSLE